MDRQDVVTLRVKVLDIITGPPTKVLLSRLATRPDGKQRLITLKRDVPDAAVRERLIAEVKTGDEIDATVVTDWTDQGYSTHLSGYSRVPSDGSETDLEYAEAVKAS